MTQEGSMSPSAGGASQVSAPAGGGAGPDPRQRLPVSKMLRSILIDAGVPAACYWLSMAFISHSEVVALIVASIFPTLQSLHALIRKGKLDPISVAILMGLLVGVGALFLGGGPKLLLIRESLFTVAFGFACLISLLFRSRRPLMFFFARYTAAGNDPAKCAWYDQLWQYAGFRRIQRVITLVWGLVFIGEFVLRLVLIYTTSPGTVLAVSPAVLGVASLLAAVWTMRYAARSSEGITSARSNGPIHEV